MNKIIRSTLTLCVAYINEHFNYRHHSISNTKVFASLRNPHRTSQLATEKYSFLSKCRFTISHGHNNSFHLNFIYKLACVASISVLFVSEEWDFRCFACAKIGVRAKKQGGGWGRGRKETLAIKPLDLENLRSPANRPCDWLG